MTIPAPAARRAADLVDVAHLVTAYFTDHPDPVRPRPAGRVRHVRATAGRASRVVQRGPHPRHDAGDLRVPPQPGHRRPAVPRPRHPRPVRAGVGRARSRCSPPTTSRCSSTRADRYTPTPAVSHAILRANGGRTTGSGLADGIVVTPSHNPPADGGFKYNPPHGGPADTDATGWIAAPGQRAARRRAGRRATGAVRPRPPARRRRTTSSARTSTTCRTSSTSTPSAAPACASAPTRSAGRASTTGPRSPSATASTSPSSTRSSTRRGGS